MLFLEAVIRTSLCLLLGVGVLFVVSFYVLKCLHDDGYYNRNM